jgi:3-oxoacyl-[acyl-carrier-protein] synthase II
MVTAPLLSRRRVVVTGMGAITPLGTSLVKTWQALVSQPSHDALGGGGMTTLEDALMLHQGGLPESILERELKLARTLPCQVAAPVQAPREIMSHDNRTSRFVQMALIAGSEAMQQANLMSWLGISSEDQTDDGTHTSDPDEIQQFRRERVGVCIGSGMSGVREVVNAMELVQERGQRRLSPHFVPKVLSNSAAGRLSLEYGLQGPNHSVSTACAAGSHAIGDAMRCIQYNNADVMLAGGAESCIDPLSMAGFCRLGALSTNFPPMESSRPFDKLRDGFVMGEGASVLVLEELEHAKRRGATILAELSGYGLTGDAFHITAPDARGRGAQRAMQMALAQAAGNDADGNEPYVGYVNAHATSTPKGDEIESRVIDMVLRHQQHQDQQHGDARGSINHLPLHVSSTKGATGHLLGAAGSIEAAFTVLSLVEQTIPPTRNLHTVDADESELSGKQMCFSHVTQPLPTHGLLQAAMSNSFGFGGTNASLVFQRYCNKS